MHRGQISVWPSSDTFTYKNERWHNNAARVKNGKESGKCEIEMEM